MATAIGSLAAPAASETNNQSPATTGGVNTDLASQSTFLTLLVAQLKQQNPMSPMDGTAFVTQLAQFSGLEQNLAMRKDLDVLTAKFGGSAAAIGG